MADEPSALTRVSCSDMPLQDFRYALRIMRLNPGFTAGVVLVLALGISVNSAIFTVVNAVLLQPLPYAAPDRLVRLYEHSPIGSSPYNVGIARQLSRLAA